MNAQEKIGLTVVSVKFNLSRGDDNNSVHYVWNRYDDTVVAPGAEKITVDTLFAIVQAAKILSKHIESSEREHRYDFSFTVEPTANTQP